jgi:thiamine transport system substrate-binding protein
MKRLLSTVLAVSLMVLTLVSCERSEAPEPQAAAAAPNEAAAQPVEITVYAYDSFISDWGPGPVIKAGFEAAYDIQVNLVSMGDSGQVLQRAILEKDRPKADVIIGIDNNLLYQSIEEEVFQPYDSPALSGIDQSLIFDPTLHVLPFDYGFFSIIYDSEVITDPPRSLEDLTDPRFEDRLIIMDPRTSSPGLGLLLWSIARYGDDYPAFWESLKPSLLTITDGWDTGYGLFTNGEAPLVLSYTTSPAYHVEYEETDVYQAAIFEEGHYLQIEGAGIVNGTEHLEQAQLFMDYLLGPEAQSAIPLTNWMYPVAEGIELPESFAYAPLPSKMLTIDSHMITEQMDSWLDTWTSIMSR